MMRRFQAQWRTKASFGTAGDPQTGTGTDIAATCACNKVSGEAAKRFSEIGASSDCEVGLTRQA